jgi:integrase
MTHVASVESSKKRSPRPWTAEELNRIVISARTMPDFVGDIPGKHFWPALILVILDTGLTAEEALLIPRTAFDSSYGQLSTATGPRQLHSLTLESLDALPPKRDRLLPWPKDSGKPPFHMLWRDYKTVLYRAGLPYTRLNSFARLNVTSSQIRNVMFQIRPILDFVCVEGKPRLMRARDRQQQSMPKNNRDQTNERTIAKDSELKKTASSKSLLKPKRVACTDNPATLLNTFWSRYCPTRLRQSVPKTINHYARTVSLLYSFAGKELLFTDLKDELVEGFLSDCFEKGCKAGTVNHYLANLLALWRFGWKKGLTSELPRDVNKLRVETHLPDAWTTEELERLLAAASVVSGDVCEIPARVWWPALILCLYDTGLRLNALMQRKVADVDFETGWISVPAADQKQRKPQRFKLHNDTLTLLKSMKPLNRPFLFPWPYVSEHKIIDAYREILSAAKLPTTSRDLFHRLRRTSGTAVAMATDENTARDHLGHSSVLMTRRYLDNRQFQPVAAADVIKRPRVASAERQ